MDRENQVEKAQVEKAKKEFNVVKDKILVLAMSGLRFLLDL